MERLGLPLLPSRTRSCTCEGITAVGTTQVGKVGRASQSSFVPGVRELPGGGEFLRDAEQGGECRSRWKMAGVSWPALSELSRSIAEIGNAVGRKLGKPLFKSVYN